MARAPQVCTKSGCPNFQPCPLHQRKPWAGSARRERLPVNWPKLRVQTKKRAGGRCQHCGCKADVGHCDHIVRGDDHRLENLQWLCPPCHERKTVAEAAAARR